MHPLPIHRALALVPALLATALTASAAEPSAHPLWVKLTKRIAEIDARADGVLGVSLRDLKANQAFDLRAQDTFPTASTIKVAILYELYRQAEEGRIDLHEVTRPPLPRVGGGGILQALGDRVSLTWRDLAVLMIGWSDNEATNRLIDRVGLPSVAARMTALGLPRVKLRRRMMDLEAARRGDENVATPDELRRLMEVVFEGRGLSAERAADLRRVASQAESYSPFRAALPRDLRALTKTGELDGVRAEVAYVELNGRPYSLAIMMKFLARDEDGKAAIREIASAVHEPMSRLARSSEHGRILED
jgi:beta-lactamase class A